MDEFRAEMLRDIKIIMRDDEAGHEWSRDNYVGGYTSYSSITDLHQRIPVFQELRENLDRHVKSYVRTLQLDLMGRKLAMTTCWINIMPPQVHHSLHLHPLSCLSGTFYLRVPKGASSFKIEDPRINCFMASPPRKAKCKKEFAPFYHVTPKEGHIVLFESWLKHEVPAHRSKTERISISFNYEWC
jgi:uncharacterized protein (TIGR02466 family)